MGMSRVQVIRLVTDLVILAVLGLVVLFINLFAHPFRRGFFCNDESIKYPHRPFTVSNLEVSLGGVLIPIVIFALIEISSPRGLKPNSAVTCGSMTLPRCVIRWLQVTGVFMFGAGIQQMIVDVAKHMMGRLRPYFIAVCDPDVGQQCTLNGTLPTEYLTEYVCRGTDENLIEEARLSFPSGHAAISFYSAVFLIMYFQCAFPWLGSKLLKHLLQFVLLMGAWFTSLSRISDYHHHWSDVLGGLCIGSLIAVLVVIFISDFRTQYSAHQKRDEEDLSLMACDTNSNNMPTTSTFDQSENGEGIQNMP